MVKGGRIFAFTALTVVGDGKGKIGIGHAKAKEVPVAISKAMEVARSNMFFVHLSGDTLEYAIEERFGASKIYMQPASTGTGIIAGGSMRAVLEAAGVRNVLAKCYGSTNPINVVKATCNALKRMHSPDLYPTKAILTIFEGFIMADKTVKVQLVKSMAGTRKIHRLSVRGLGLRKLGQTVEVQDTPSNRGMINKVSYLLKILDD